MDEIREYEYSSISNSFIRLLQLHERDSSLGDDDNLRGSLRKVPVDNSETYDTVSYACGDPNKDGRILIDGKEIKITKNCHNALCHLRDEFGVRAIWVDAICISQSNNDEKKDQILLMTGIYSNARTVYIWLGKDNSLDSTLDWLETALAGDTYPLLSVRMANFPENMHWRELVKLFHILPEIFKARLRRLVGPRSSNSQAGRLDRQAMTDLLQRQWFKRSWTLQEAVMAGEAFVVSGSRKVRWNRLFSVIADMVEARTEVINGMAGELAIPFDSVYVITSLWLETTSLKFRWSAHRRWLPEDSVLYGTWIDFLDFMEKFGARIAAAQLAGIVTIAIKRFLQGHRPLDSPPLVVLVWLCVMTLILTPPKTNVHWDENLRNTLVNVLNKCRNQEARQPKDKVYALYGILQRLEIPLPDPNYSEEYSLEDTYRDFTRSIIKWHKSLEILLESSGPWSRNAPSWVPDWSRSYNRPQFRHPELDKRSLPPPGNPSFSFNPQNNNELTVVGIRAGKVTFKGGPIRMPSVELNVTEGFTPTLREKSLLREDTTVFREWLQVAQEVYSLSVDDICEFLVSLSTWQGIHMAGDFREWVRMIQSDRLTISDNQGPSFTRTWRLHQNICSMLGEHMAVFVAEAEGRHMLGVGATSIQPGDDIMIFATPNTPMVMRLSEKAKGKFELMGATHLPNLPHALLKPFDTIQDAEKETFVIV